MQLALPSPKPQPVLLRTPLVRAACSRSRTCTKTLQVVAGLAWALPRRQRVRCVRRLQQHAVLEDFANVDSQAVRRWLQEVIIGYNFCPYAQPTASNGHIRVVTSSAEAPEGVLQDLDAEALRLPRGPLKDLAEGEPATTLLVCPHVSAWQSFEAFQEFYQGKLMNGYLFAEKDLYMVSFHPEYGNGRSIQTGDAIEVGDQQAIVRDSAAGFSETGSPVAMVQLADGQETYIELPQPVDDTEKLVSKAPRVALHLLRNCDLEEANDGNIHRRNGVTIGEVGEEEILDAIRRCG